MAQFFLIIKTGYTSVDVALARELNGESVIVHSIAVLKKYASRDLINAIHKILELNALCLSDMAFIAAYQGPAPFTTLRTALATVNGISFATRIPLVGIDGLDAFMHDIKPHLKTRYCAILLNAFCDDVYYALYDSQTLMTKKGCCNIAEMLQQLGLLDQEDEHNNTITCVGNAVTLHKDRLKTINNIIIPDSLPEECSLTSVCSLALQAWDNKKIESQILPHYLKEFSATIGNNNNIQ